ncbi:kelch-domain-containing protein/putative Tip elongation aberrant protein 1 [Blumeria hordei DH14]|uniref:Kelch-domain-containing protein/putative Tip elongation aberrant protein 1 n=1 Tax=Blumeria graminis f. sp. hordei (strain DH14) TaxID=546991 RepID=N1JI09_BLUG1|nr:kelch-domain-containing protein/putative Tip elongation aberrant protein 1 [Blumeria hordei DH14]
MAFLFKSKKNGDRSQILRDGSKASAGLTATNQGVNFRMNEKGIGYPPPAINGLNETVAPSPAAPAGTPSPEQINGRRTIPLDQSQDLPLRSGTAPAVQPMAANPNSLYPWSQARLTYTTALQGPFPRYGAAVNATASKEGNIYLMGGLINSSMVKGDLWMVEAGGNMACYPLSTTAEGPNPRVGHASLLVGNAFIIYGGDTKMEDSDILDETLYLLNTSTRQWSRAVPAGPRPTGRYGHSLNILGSKIYVFGGQVEGYFMNDLVAFDLNQLQVPTNRWEMLIRNSDEGGPPPGQIPPARTNHSIVTYNEKLFLFGGTNGFQWFNDVWSYEPTSNSWASLDCIGYIPSPREGHAAAIVDDVMYIFGGRTEDGSDLGDLAAFRIPSRRWYTFQNMGPSPSPRSGHSMTAHGKQIIVLAGEPSSATREVGDLSIVYILDTTKIRYPNDHPAQLGSDRIPGGRRPSTSDKALPSTTRGTSIRDAMTSPEAKKSNEIVGRGNSQNNSNWGEMNGIATSTHTQTPLQGQLVNSKLPRATPSQTSSGPPPQQQAPTPRSNSATSNAVGRNRSQARHETSRSSSVDVTARNGDIPSGVSPTHSVTTSLLSKDGSKEVLAENRKVLAGQSSPASKPSSAENGPPVSMNTIGSGSLRPSSRNRSNRQQSSVDSTNDHSSLRNMTNARQTSPPPSNRNLINPLVRKGSARNSQAVSLLKELDVAKNRNAWYASELELARKAGYTPSTPNCLDHKSLETFDDDDKPLIEALISMKTELANVQGSIDRQAILAAKQISEVEKQRDSAVREAIYAKAKLAAHCGNQDSILTPDSESYDVGTLANDRAVDISRKLATALSDQNKLQSTIEALNTELEAEKRSRKVAEDIAKTSQARISELESYKQQNSSEVERLKAELHESQVMFRKESIACAEAVASAQLLQADKDELDVKFLNALGSSKDTENTFASLQEAMGSLVEMRSLLQRQLDDERLEREKSEAKLSQMRSEHESCTTQLEAITRKLQCAEELIQTQENEAKSQWQAIQEGLARVVSVEVDTPKQANDQRLVALQTQVQTANDLVRKYQAAADTASEKLRSAEERIAGLEAYQEQASREGMSIRKQLQASMREIQSLQASNTEMKYQLENQQLESNAVHVQHNTLKYILEERSATPTKSSRTRGLSSPPSMSDATDVSQIKTLEQQLLSSLEAQEEAKQMYEAREQESERLYREKLTQLESDYQSAVNYVKGTEKMLKRLNDELTRYKSDNIRLNERISGVDEGMAGGNKAATWENERSELYKQIKVLQGELKIPSKQFEQEMADVRNKLLSAEQERDMLKRDQEDLQNQVKADLAKVQEQKVLLLKRAEEAERKVSVLLDQVEQSVDIYRRNSRSLDHRSATPTAASTTLYQRSPLVTDSASEASYESGNRSSMALDSLANELETLRSHWQNTNKNYRLSNAFDFDERTVSTKGPDEMLTAPNVGEGLTSSLASWRKRLDSDQTVVSSQINGPTENIVNSSSAQNEAQPSELSANNLEKGELNAI